MSLRDDYKPYLEQIKNCWCDTCAHHAIGTVPTVLLEDLRAGRHVFLSKEDYAAEARARRDERIAEARANGASASHIATLERGYAVVRERDFYATGSGLGLTIR
jgi:hypothetical protein